MHRINDGLQRSDKANLQQPAFPSCEVVNCFIFQWNQSDHIIVLRGCHSHCYLHNANLLCRVVRVRLNYFQSIELKGENPCLNVYVVC